jgi:hypothetical protein
VVGFFPASYIFLVRIPRLNRLLFNTVENDYLLISLFLSPIMRNKNRRGNNPTQRERAAKRAAKAAQASSQPATQSSSQSVASPASQHRISKKWRPPRIILPPPPPPPSSPPLVSFDSPLPSPGGSDFLIFEDKENSDPLAGPGPGLIRQPLTEVTVPIPEDENSPGAIQQPAPMASPIEFPPSPSRLPPSINTSHVEATPPWPGPSSRR